MLDGWQIHLLSVYYLQFTLSNRIFFLSQATSGITFAVQGKIVIPYGDGEGKFGGRRVIAFEIDPKEEQ